MPYRLQPLSPLDPCRSGISWARGRRTMTRILGAGGEEWRTFEQLGGYDPSAWEEPVAAAAARIEELRTREARVRLVDRRGAPLANCAVEVVQTDDAFDWGYCGWGYLTRLQHGEFDHYEHLHQRQRDLGLYNSINCMHYWAERHCTNAPQSEEHQGHVDYEVLDRLVQWARGNGLRCKGHPLYWPVPKAIPEWLLRYDHATRLKFLEVRIRQLTARFKGRIGTYDAVNEMMWEPTLARTEERHWPHLEAIEAIADEAAAVIGWARDEDPDARYTLNEYGLVRGETEPLPVKSNAGEDVTRDGQLDRFIALGRCLVERGQAPDLLGIQSAPGDWRLLPRFVATIDAIGEGTGLPVQVTEFRTGTRHLEEAGMEDDAIDACFADYVEAVCTVCFGNPHCSGFWFWGLPRLVRGRKPTAVYARVRELLRERWRTSTTATTDDDGHLAFRGFLGDYSLRLRRGSGQPSGFPLTIAAGPGAQESSIAVPFV